MKRYLSIIDESSEIDWKSLLDSEYLNKLLILKTERTKKMKRLDILEEAGRIISQDRNLQNGEPEKNFEVIAELWSNYLDLALFPEDVAVLMILLKVARIKKSSSIKDYWLDIIGYAACGYEVSQVDLYKEPEEKPTINLKDKGDQLEHEINKAMLFEDCISLGNGIKIQVENLISSITIDKVLMSEKDKMLLNKLITCSIFLYDTLLRVESLGEFSQAYNLYIFNKVSNLLTEYTEGFFGMQLIEKLFVDQVSMLTENVEKGISFLDSIISLLFPPYNSQEQLKNICDEATKLGKIIQEEIDQLPENSLTYYSLETKEDRYLFNRLIRCSILLSQTLLRVHDEPVYSILRNIESVNTIFSNDLIDFHTKYKSNPQLENSISSLIKNIQKGIKILSSIKSSLNKELS